MKINQVGNIVQFADIEWNNQPVGNVWLNRRYLIEEICLIQLGKYIYPKPKGPGCKGINHAYYYQFGGICEDCKKEY